MGLAELPLVGSGPLREGKPQQGAPIENLQFPEGGPPPVGGDVQGPFRTSLRNGYGTCRSHDTRLSGVERKEALSSTKAPKLLIPTMNEARLQLFVLQLFGMRRSMRSAYK